MDSSVLKQRATVIWNRAADANNIGQHEPSFFDTALIASLETFPTDGIQDRENTNFQEQLLLFPDALKYVLATQHPQNGWEGSMEGFAEGCTLNGLAGLLALVRFKRFSGELASCEQKWLLDVRIQTAREYLDMTLRSCDLDNDAHLPLLQLIGRLRRLLEKEGAHLSWRNCESLVLPDITPEKNSAVNEVEGDAEEKRTHGIASSPGLTALHVLETGSNDPGYVTYLRNAVITIPGSAGVPAVFPRLETGLTSLFEVLKEHELLNEKVERVGGMNGKIEKKDVNISTKGLEEGMHQRSLDKHCEILSKITRDAQQKPDNAVLAALFERVNSFWWSGDWVLTVCQSEFYAFMLYAQSYNRMLKASLFDAASWDRETLEVQAPIVLTQMLGRVLARQNPNGTWGPSPHQTCLESTAFNLSTLAVVIEQQMFQPLRLEIQHAIERGRDALIAQLQPGKSVKSNTALWLHPTPHRSSLLCEAYIIAALSSTSPEKLSLLCTAQPTKAHQKILALSHFFHSNPNLSAASLYRLKLGAIESGFYVLKLKAMPQNIFPATSAKEKDKYLNYIPIMCTIHNIVREVWAPPSFIWDICVVSLYIFLVDEYMEGSVAKLSRTELVELRHGVEKMFALEDEWMANSKDLKMDGQTHPLLRIATSTSVDSETRSQAVQEALRILSKWAKQYFSYPSLTSASTLDLLDVRMEAKNYLVAHLHQITDNQRLLLQDSFSVSTPFASSQMGYAPWLHTVGGVHIGAALGLTWFAACVGSKIRGRDQDCWSNVKQKCMAWNANSHSAKQLRMFNDFGSIARDFEERNLNSVNFPEFFSVGDGERREAAGKRQHGDFDELDEAFEVKKRKVELLDAAYYERKRTEEELAGLYTELRKEGKKGAKLADWLGVYMAGADQFSDMYLLRDVTNSTR